MNTQKMMNRELPTKQGMNMGTEPAAESQAQYDLQGIDAIVEFMQRGSSELGNWRKYYGFPMTKVDHIFCAQKMQIIEWMALRKATIATINGPLLEAWYHRQCIIDGTRPARYGGKVLHDVNDIAKLFCIPTNIVMDWCRSLVDWPLPAGQKNGFSILADDMHDWFDLHGIKIGRNDSGCYYARSF